MTVNPRSANVPFKPFLATAAGRSPALEDFQEPDVDLLAQISEEVADPWIQGRLADIAWLLKKPRNPRYALVAIDAYSKIPLDVETWLRGGQECWERAITLSRMLGAGAGQRLQNLERAMVEAFRDAKQGDGFHSLWLADVLLANALGRDNSPGIAERLASLAQLSEGEGSFPKAHSFFDASAKWFKRAGNTDRWTATTVSLAESWAKEAAARTMSGQRGSAVAASFYESAIQIYRTIPRAQREAHPVQARIAELHRLMNEAGRNSLEEMGRVSVGPIDIAAIVEAARNAVMGKSALEALAALANIHGPTPLAQRRRRSEATLATYLSHRLFSSVHVSRDGRVIAKTPATDSTDANTDEYDSAVYAEMIRDFEIELSLIVQGTIWPALDVLILEHRLCEADFVGIASRSPIVPRARERLFGKALFLGYERDFSGALYLLVPQIENMVRFHLKAAGVKTTNLDENGIENENGLSRLADLPETAKVFGDDLAFEIKALLCDPRGPNLRNEAAHGLLDYDASESIYGVYAWWLTLKVVFSTFWNAMRSTAVEDASGDQAGVGADKRADSHPSSTASSSGGSHAAPDREGHCP